MSARWRAFAAALLTTSVIAAGCSSGGDDPEAAAEPDPTTTMAVEGDDAPAALRGFALAQSLWTFDRMSTFDLDATDETTAMVDLTPMILAELGADTDEATVLSDTVSFDQVDSLRRAGLSRANSHELGGFGEDLLQRPRSSLIEFPPSTVMSWPVMYDAPSLARNAIACATSSAVPDRPTGVAAPILDSYLEADAVLIHPGATALTVTPAAAVSIAVASVSPTTPAFAAW